MKSPTPLLPTGAALLFLLGSAVAATAAPGDLDSGFGTQGVALAAIGDDGAIAMVLQADGRPLTATLAEAGGDRATLRLTRFTTGGLVDSTFGTGGTASVQLPVDTQSTVTSMLRQSTDNRLLVAGRSLTAFAVTRLTTAGALDNTFGTGGTAKTTISGDDEILALAQQTDGKIVAVGRADDGRDSDFAVVRYTTTGQLDTTFSGDGIQTVEFGGNDVARAVAVHSDGTIVVAGSTEGNSSDIAVARLTSTGVLDTTFDGDGKATTSASTGDDAAHAVLVQTDGKPVVAGEAGDDFVVVRYTAAGAPDPGFGASGIRRSDLSSGGNDAARAIVRQSDDKLVAAGVANPGRAGAFALVRYTTTGQLDTTFSGDGIVTTTPSAIFDDNATALALQGDGKLVAAGVAEDGSTTYQMVARYAGAPAAATCGNGVVEGTEQCDDSNTVAGDGCSATCTLESQCGDADRNGSITSTDSLRTLRAAVGQPVSCPDFVCDVDNNSTVTSTDALKVLKKAVGQPITLTCPLP